MKKIIILLFLFTNLFLIYSVSAYAYQFNKKTGIFMTNSFGRRTEFLLSPIIYKLKSGRFTVFANSTNTYAMYTIFYGKADTKHGVEQIVVKQNYTTVTLNRNKPQKFSFTYSELFLPEPDLRPTVMLPQIIIKKNYKEYGFISGGLLYFLKITKRADILSVGVYNFKKKKLEKVRKVLGIGVNLVAVAGKNMDLFCSQYKCFIH